jgi:hypothetical protein
MKKKKWKQNSVMFCKTVLDTRLPAWEEIFKEEGLTASTDSAESCGQVQILCLDIYGWWKVPPCI